MFETLMVRTNGVALARLSNATMVFGAASARVIFNRTPVVSLNVSETNPEVQFAQADFPGIGKNSAVTIGGDSFLIASKPEPDGTGMAVAHLQVVS
jgi:hypothetical protein